MPTPRIYVAEEKTYVLMPNKGDGNVRSWCCDRPMLLDSTYCQTCGRSMRNSPHSDWKVIYNNNTKLEQV